MSVTIGADAAKKFTLLVDLGIITVPDDYAHSTRLSSFKAKYQNDKIESFYHYDENITDTNFSNPRMLKPGDKLHVRAFRSGSTTSVECMAFLATQKAIHTGAQGATLVWEQKRYQLPMDYWYTSFDKKERSLEDTDGYYGVPYIHVGSGGDFSSNFSF